MDDLLSQKPSLKTLRRMPRKPINLLQGDTVKTRYLNPEQAIPFVIEPLVDRIDLPVWAYDSRALIDALLMEHRALLFRGFDVKSPSDFKRFAAATCNGELLDYNDRSSPRHEIGDKIYVSTIYPADRKINLHNEGSYWLAWVLKIYFCCLKAPESGGETPIADVRQVFARLDPTITESFRRKQVMYVRNYNDGFGLTWQEVFQTNDPAKVEAYCCRNEIEYEWKGERRLRTRQVRPAVRQHPQTGEWVWFNHAAFFHISSREPEVHQGLLDAFDEQDLPYMTYYGDGMPIEPSIIEEVKEAYQQEKRVFAWQEGDILMLDNMSVAHGREPYTGPRQVIVAMGEQYQESNECNA